MYLFNCWHNRQSGCNRETGAEREEGKKVRPRKLQEDSQHVNNGQLKWGGAEVKRDMTI